MYTLWGGRRYSLASMAFTARRLGFSQPLMGLKRGYLAHCYKYIGLGRNDRVTEMHGIPPISPLSLLHHASFFFLVLLSDTYPYPGGASRYIDRRKQYRPGRYIM